MTNEQIYKKWCKEMSIKPTGLVIEDSPFETEDDEELTFSIYTLKHYIGYVVKFFNEDDKMIKEVRYLTLTNDDFYKVLCNDDCDPIWLAQKLWDEKRVG